MYINIFETHFMAKDKEKKISASAKNKSSGKINQNVNSFDNYPVIEKYF